MARPLPLLCCCIAALLPAAASSATLPERCKIPEKVNNADIQVGDNDLLNARLRYTCKDGYKRKAGTSSLIVCIKNETTNMVHWTQTNLQCIRDPALPPTSSPNQKSSAETTSLVYTESKTFTPSKQPETRVTTEITKVPVMASTPSFARETTSPLAGPISQHSTHEPSWGTLATTATEIRSSEVPASMTMEDTTQRRITAAQDTHTSQRGTDESELETVTTEEERSTAVPANGTTGESTQLPTAVTHDTKVAAQVTLSSVGGLIMLITVAVLLYCVWKRRAHMRRQYTISLRDFPVTPEELEERDRTPQDNNSSNDPEHPSERTEMMSASCEAPTG